METVVEKVQWLVSCHENAFAILGATKRELTKRGLREEATTYYQQATSGDYAHLCSVSLTFASKCDQYDDEKGY